jgi:hypothetical protein
MPVAAPPRIWTRFLNAAAISAPSVLPSGARVTRYSIEAIDVVRGGDSLPFVPRSELVRVEAESSLFSHSQGLVGVTGHVLYTGLAARAELAAMSAKESGPWAVLIPIRKSDAWWAMAQDERAHTFRGATRSPGHHSVAAEYAARIFRRLYHARSLPDSGWDFLTYFEFPDEARPEFLELLAKLRDPRLNPEWEFVEAEIECWMRKS